MVPVLKSPADAETNMDINNDNMRGAHEVLLEEGATNSLLKIKEDLTREVALEGFLRDE